MTATTNIESAIRRMPKCLESGFDVMKTKTINDLWWYVRISLDDYELGEDEADIQTPAQAAASRRYLDWLAARR